MVGNNHPNRSKQPKWQPIETAPRDGTRVLIWSPEDAATFACAFEAGRWQTGVWRAKPVPYTHWMALPSPPTLTT